MNAPDTRKPIIYDRQTSSLTLATPSPNIDERLQEGSPAHNNSAHNNKPPSTFETRLKRLVDVIVSVLALVCLSPLLLIIALAVRFSSPGPVLYRQQRLGKDGVAFTLYKFRTMYDGAPEVRVSDGSNVVAKNDSRLTSLGRFLRSFSFDELLQFLNVAKGDMSLVGPRPDQVDHLALYSETDKQKLSMKPGLTGLAMVRGRNAIPWKERVRLDVWYVEHYSLWLDLRIVMATMAVLLFRRGVYATPQSVDEEDKNRA